MAFGLGVLRLSPSEFWAATPRELAAAAEGALGKRRSAEPPTAAAMRALMRAFPDQPFPGDRGANQELGHDHS